MNEMIDRRSELNIRIAEALGFRRERTEYRSETGVLRPDWQQRNGWVYPPDFQWMVAHSGDWDFRLPDFIGMIEACQEQAQFSLPFDYEWDTDR